MEVIKNVPFSPAITGSLLYLLTKAPERVKQPVLDQLSRYLSRQNISRAITTLKWLVALGLARNFHVFLSELAQNNFRLRSERRKYDWPKEIAVVTGAASGFGALISKDLAAKGVNVMAVDIRDELPSDMKDVSQIHYYKCDITDRQAVMDLAEQIKREHGSPSILVNNAGVAYRHSVLDASEKALNNLFNVNIISHYWTLQAFLPDMIKNKKGHVVSLASMASFISPPGLIPYCNTKHAVLSLHNGLQQEVRVTYKCPEIKFTSIHPTFAATNMTKDWSSILASAKTHVLNPQVVADAVVNQIMACRGRQIIIAPGTSFLSSIHGWPHYLSQAVLHSTDRTPALAEIGKEQWGG